MSDQPKFTQFETSYEYAKRTEQISVKRSFEDFFKSQQRGIRSELNNGPRDFALQNSLAEATWVHIKRPFYRVWPSVLPGFTRTNLNVSTGDIQLPAKAISIELPVGSFPACALAYEYDSPSSDKRGLVVVAQWGNGKKDETHFQCVLSSGQTFEDSISHAIQNSQKGIDPKKVDGIETSIRTVVCVCLIAKDPRFVESICLAKDRHRRTPENADQLQEKAKRRGTFGWDVGRSVEVGPHVRRPHFGIRWTGKGGAEPRLVPISGAIVKGRKITDVPTGWHGEVE